MKILLVHQYFLEDYEGGGSRWNEMCREWTKAGHEITVLAGMSHYMGGGSNAYQRGFIEKGVNKDGIKVIRCFVYSKNGSGFVARLLAYFTFAFSSIWAGLFYARERFEVIVVTSPPLFVGITALVLSWVKRTPFVFEVRDLWPESAIETGFLKNRLLVRFSFWFEKFLYSKAKLIAVLTPAFREVLINKKGITPQKVFVISNGADFNCSEHVMATLDVADFRKRNGLENKFVVTYVGAHGVANHLIQILETAQLLRETNVCFLLIGAGPEKAALKSECSKRNLENVRFLDLLPRKEALRYIAASDMGASILKKTDIFKTIYSNKTFDYFSCKKPVLMAIDGISRRLVEEAKAGVFVEPENPEDFANKIRLYMNNPELLHIQGENGYIYAKSHFDRKVLADAFLKEIERLK